MPVRKLLPVLWLPLMVVGIAHAGTAGIRKSASLHIQLVIVDSCNIQFVPETPPRGIAARVDCTAATPYRLVLTPAPGSGNALPGQEGPVPAAASDPAHSAAGSVPEATVATITF